jgi:hypothetical protein
MRRFQPLLHGHLLELLGASTRLAICSKSPCSIAISSWPYLQHAISSSPPLQLSRKVVRIRSEHSSQSAPTLHYARTHPGTIAERNFISAKLARLCGDSRPHWVQTEKAEIPSWCGTSVRLVHRTTGKTLPLQFFAGGWLLIIHNVPCRVCRWWCSRSILFQLYSCQCIFGSHTQLAKAQGYLLWSWAFPTPVSIQSTEYTKIRMQKYW